MTKKKKPVKSANNTKAKTKAKPSMTRKYKPKSSINIPNARILASMSSLRPKKATHNTHKSAPTFNGALKKKINPGRTADGKVPKGRTLSTCDKYLDKKAKEPNKERPVVVIEANAHNDLAVVPLSSRKGKNRTQLKNYQQGQSYFKHYVETADDEGKPIRVNQKFKENHPDMDVSVLDVTRIIDKVMNKSQPAQENRKKMVKYRENKKNP